MQFAKKVIRGEGHRLYYIRGTTDIGLATWYFALIRPTMLAAYEKLDKKSHYDIADYGDVLLSGYGEYAPDDVIERMNREYNCQFSN
ncbi:MAG: hypothetical protein EBR02_08760 [Alphaproteobacteria bacterium]|nr:hypothetical protein [Alphaproteobacteria bacterium]